MSLVRKGWRRTRSGGWTKVRSSRRRRNPGQRGRAADWTDVEHLKRAAELLKRARVEMRPAGAKHALAFLDRARKSLDGAIRHAEGMARRPDRLRGRYSQPGGLDFYEGPV